MANRNRLALRNDVYLRLAESGSGFYTDAEINQWLNDGVRNIAVHLEPNMTSATVATIAGTREYALPNDTLSIRNAFFYDGTAWVPLDRTTWEDLYDEDPDWQNDPNGLPESWYWRQAAIGLHPAPSATYAAVNTLRILYTYIPASMDVDSSITNLPEYLDDAVVLFAVVKGYQKDRSFDKANAIAEEYSRNVSDGAIKINRHTKRTAPRLIPDQAPYRLYYMSRGRRGRVIRVQDS